jgi:catechol 2,3-dioxygenase-like lactoylglutathione lyase family enzyme
MGAQSSKTGDVDLKLEVIVIPVSDANRAADFYQKLGWRKDADIPTDGGGRILQFTPPGSPASVLFGTGLVSSPPGSAQFVHLVVSDIQAARDALASKGVKISEVFHDAGGGFNRFDPRVRASGPDPEHRSYASFATFDDPDGNTWVLQEITQRREGRVDPDMMGFASVKDLSGALRRAEAAHGEHEKRMGGVRDENWPDWYAAYMVAEQSGQPLPT